MPQNEDLFSVPVPISGALSVAAGVLRYGIPHACELVRVDATINTAPATTDVIFDVNKNGTTVFTDQSKRPKILAAANAGSAVPAANVAAAQSAVGQPNATAVGYANVITASVPNPTTLGSFAAGDYVTVDVDQIGTGTVGSNAVVTLTFRNK